MNQKFHNLLILGDKIDYIDVQLNVEREASIFSIDTLLFFKIKNLKVKIFKDDQQLSDDSYKVELLADQWSIKFRDAFIINQHNRCDFIFEFDSYSFVDRHNELNKDWKPNESIFQLSPLKLDYHCIKRIVYL